LTWREEGGGSRTKSQQKIAPRLNIQEPKIASYFLSYNSFYGIAGAVDVDGQSLLYSGTDISDREAGGEVSTAIVLQGLLHRDTNKFQYMDSTNTTKPMTINCR
jgi:hypothetical protein